MLNELPQPATSIAVAELLKKKNLDQDEFFLKSLRNSTQV